MSKETNRRKFLKATAATGAVMTTGGTIPSFAQELGTNPKVFGGRGCSTHSPSTTRPGPLGSSLTTRFGTAGYPIATTADSARTLLRLIEMYPHPALLTLLGRSYRVPYKVSKARRYWPTASVSDRIELLLAEFKAIDGALSKVIGHTGLHLPSTHCITTLNRLKRYEDVIDALISGWVGILYLEGRVIPHGDRTAAIWCPC